MAIVFNNLSAGGGSKLYEHNITWNTASVYGAGRIATKIINDNATPFTTSTFMEYLFNNGYTTVNNGLTSVGCIGTSTALKIITNLYVDSTTADAIKGNQSVVSLSQQSINDVAYYLITKEVSNTSSGVVFKSTSCSDFVVEL